MLVKIGVNNKSGMLINIWLWRWELTNGVALYSCRSDRLRCVRSDADTACRRVRSLASDPGLSRPGYLPHGLDARRGASRLHARAAMAHASRTAGCASNWRQGCGRPDRARDSIRTEHDRCLGNRLYIHDRNTEAS